MDTVVLYRPVGTKELTLIRGSGFRAFPPRLPSQPIFYPVLDLEYARQIAKDWNARQSENHRGYVTRFEVAAEYLAKHEIHTVGGRQHQEYWIPTEELPEFNANIVGMIQVVEEFTGPDPLKH